MKYLELKKYFDETNKQHSLGRLLSYYVIITAIIFTAILIGMNISGVDINTNLIWLNGSIYTIGLGGKVAAKKYENKNIGE